MYMEAGYDVQYRLLKGKTGNLAYYPKLETFIWKSVKKHRSGLVTTQYGTTYQVRLPLYDQRNQQQRFYVLHEPSCLPPTKRAFSLFSSSMGTSPYALYQQKVCTYLLFVVN